MYLKRASFSFAVLWCLISSLISHSADGRVFVIQGEKGPGLDCSGNDCTVSDGSDLMVGGGMTVQSDLAANNAVVETLAVGEILLTTRADSPCPRGYSRNTEISSNIICEKALTGGKLDVLVKVGDYWIDKYEMSVWNNASCADLQFGVNVDDWSLSNSGNWQTAATDEGYACSIADTAPSRFMTWFQAQQACRVAGKALCTNAQWQGAAVGTPDRHIRIPDDEFFECHIWGDVQPMGAAWVDDTTRTTVLTGSASECISNAGVNDMVGNVAEWVADWFEGGEPWMFEIFRGVPPWPAGGEFNLDITYNVDGAAHNGYTYTIGAPAAVHRGGAWDGSWLAGVYSLSAELAPSFSSSRIGARCCIRE